MTTIRNTSKKIDVHSHILWGLDHGAKEVKESEKLIDSAKKHGITDIICTPHYLYRNDKYNGIFNKLSKYAKEYGINLYKGNEIMLNQDTLLELKNKKAFTLNNSKYVLVELMRYTSYEIEDIIEFIEELIEKKYIVIMAHPELIVNALNDIDELITLSDMGVLFQIDAKSYFLKRKYRLFISKMIKYDLVDFIASDAHYNDNTYKYFDKLYEKITNRYGKKYADKLFVSNAEKIIAKKTVKKVVSK